MVGGKIQHVHRIQVKRTIYLCTFQVKEGKRPNWSQNGVEVQRFKTPMRSPCIKSAPSPAAKADLVLRERHTHLQQPLRADLNQSSHGMSKLFSFHFERFATLATLS